MHSVSCYLSRHLRGVGVALTALTQKLLCAIWKRARLDLEVLAAFASAWKQSRRRAHQQVLLKELWNDPPHVLLEQLPFAEWTEVLGTERLTGRHLERLRITFFYLNISGSRQFVSKPLTSRGLSPVGRSSGRAANASLFLRLER